MSLTPLDRDLSVLYQAILDAWNSRAAAAMAAQFAADGSMIGFDGSQVDTRRAIEANLGPIFASHATPTYVAKVREVRGLSPTVAVLRAVAGMVPRGGADLNPALNTVHTLVGVLGTEGWRAAVLQSTPAAWHGRPEDVAALGEELRLILRQGVTIA
jgi:uncharacterized protein (TIGR02246 family)